MVSSAEYAASEYIGKAKSVKRFERSNGLDTALYKNYFFFYNIDCAVIHAKGDFFFKRSKNTKNPRWRHVYEEIQDAAIL